MHHSPINILRAQTCNYAQLLDCLQSYALLPTIDKPTRVYNNSATLIDNIFTNKFYEYFASGNIIVSDITDHFSQFCVFQSSIEATQPAKITVRDYSKSSEQRFLQDLSQLHWESLLSGSDVNKLFSTFIIS